LLLLVPVLHVAYGCLHQRHLLQGLLLLLLLLGL
jgi:hypothetical protein